MNKETRVGQTFPEHREGFGQEFILRQRWRILQQVIKGRRRFLEIEGESPLG